MKFIVVITAYVKIAMGQGYREGLPAESGRFFYLELDKQVDV